MIDFVQLSLTGARATCATVFFLLHEWLPLPPESTRMKVNCFLHGSKALSVCENSLRRRVSSNQFVAARRCRDRACPPAHERSEGRWREYAESRQPSP